MSIFAYVGMFYTLPTALRKSIKGAISKLVIPFDGGAYTYTSLVCGVLFNIKTALKDV